MAYSTASYGIVDVLHPTECAIIESEYAASTTEETLQTAS
jgi:hypothetical protein